MMMMMVMMTMMMMITILMLMLIMMMPMAMQLIGKIKNKNKSNSHEVFDAALIIMIHNDNRIVVRSCLRRTDRSRYATTPTGALSHTPPPS